jgi:hypothetical protein
MGYPIDDARNLTLYNKGLYGEWRIIEHDAERVLDIRSMISYGDGKVKVDIKETDRLVDAKFWNEDTFNQLIYKGNIYKKSIDEMLRYKKAMEVLNISKFYFVFVDYINDELFEKRKHTILKELMDRIGDVSWIEIVNGLDKYE